MSIPVTASTEAFTPACMEEVEGAPTFTFRHARVTDKLDFQGLVIEEGLKQYSETELREARIDALRAGFTSEGMEHNITRIRAYWALTDEYKSAMREHVAICDQIKAEHAGDGEPQLPPMPVLDLDEAEARQISELLADVEEAECARPVRKMERANHRFQVLLPRIMLRMFLKSTSLPVTLARNDGVLTEEAVEAVLEGLMKEAKDAGVSPDLAAAQLFIKASLAFKLTGDEEKNSSSPRSGSSSPKSSASKQSSGPQTPPTPSPSSVPAISEGDTGSISSASGSPASA